MKHKGYQLSLAIALAVLIWLMGTKPSPAHACLPAGRFNYTVKERTQAAELVFEGTVWRTNLWSLLMGQSKAPSNTNYGDVGAASVTSSGANVTATIIVDQYLKGDGPTIIEITGFGLGGGDCLSIVGPGNHLLFFANGTPEQGFTANYLGVYSATEKVTPTTISDVISANGQSPVEKKLTTREQITIFWFRIRWWLGGITIITAVVVIWLAWRKMGRRSVMRDA